MMEDHPVPLTPEMLHSERDWVRRVALALVADQGRAEDLEQQLWVKALERPPLVRRSLRGWLRSSLRSMAADFRRADHRRRKHEEAAAGPAAAGHAPAAVDLVARAEALRLVVDAVLALREPYRTTVLLRFGEDLPPAAMARRLGIPLETVRTRLRRGLEELRERFDPEGFAALLPLVLPDLPGPPPPVVPPESGAWAGADRAAAEAARAVSEVTTMSVRIFLLSALSVAVVGAAAFWAAREAPRSPEVPVTALPPNPSSPRQAVVEPAAPPVVASMSEQDRAKLKAELRAELLAELGKATAESRVLPDKQASEPSATEALLARFAKMARSPTWERKEPLDVEGALKDAEALLARNLGAEERAKALVDKAILLRSGPGADPVLEEQALREAADLQGEDTKTGRDVRFQLAWTRSRRGDDREAVDLFATVAGHADTEPGFRATNRWEAAVRADRLGDKDRARLWYRAFIDENGSAEGDWFRKNVARAKERLKELE